MNASRRYFGSLTGLRAIAAHMVLFHHMIIDQNLSWPIFHLYTGVVIFFVLSGFLITYQNFDLIQSGAFRSADYFVKRFGRIYPLYFMAFVMTMYFEPVGDPRSFTFWFLNLTLLKGWSFHYVYSGVGQAWTLTIEETFYALAPILFYFLARKSSRFWLLLPTSFALGFAQFALGRVYPRNLNLPHDLASLTQLSFFFMFFPLAIGMLSALIYLKKFPRLHSFFVSLPLTYFALALCVLNQVVLETVKPFCTQVPFLVVQPLVEDLFLPLSVGLLLLGLIQERTFFSRLLASAPMQALGRSSYALYLFGMGVFAERLMEEARWTSAIYFPVLFVLSINAVTWLLYKFYEEPLARFFRARTSG